MKRPRKTIALDIAPCSPRRFCRSLGSNIESIEYDHQNRQYRQPAPFHPVSALNAFTTAKLPHVGQIDRIDHDLSHLDPNLPLCDVVHGLCSTDPTQEKRVESWR